MKAAYVSFVVLIALCVVFPATSLAVMKETVPFTATLDADGIQRAEIVGGSYFFKPNDITVKVNVPVEFKVSKEAGMVPHNISVKAPEAGMDFSVSLAKDPQIIKFTPTKTGKYPMICSKKFLWMSHQDKGMEGVIEVVE